MGAAAYQRGNDLIRQQTDMMMPSAIMQVIERLNAVPKLPHAGIPFGPVHILQYGNSWWIECPVTGFGYWYKTLTALLAAWDVTITGINGNVYLAEPNAYDPYK